MTVKEKKLALKVLLKTTAGIGCFSGALVATVATGGVGAPFGGVAITSGISLFFSAGKNVVELFKSEENLLLNNQTSALQSK
ncbi:MAG: hypothetical protein ACX932_03785 [Gammaproteobacteria bacterium]